MYFTACLLINISSAKCSLTANAIKKKERVLASQQHYQTNYLLCSISFAIDDMIIFGLK